MTPTPTHTAEREGLVEALRDCQKTLAMLIDPANFDASISHAWAACVASEAKARSALESTPSEVGEAKPVAWADVSDHPHYSHPQCEHCHGTGQPHGIKGGPDHGICGFCGGSGFIVPARALISTLEITDEAPAWYLLISPEGNVIEGHHLKEVAERRHVAFSYCTLVPVFLKTGGEKSDGWRAEMDKLWRMFVVQCESIEDREAPASDNEHEMGFYRGEKSAAKSIRRSVEHPKYNSTDFPIYAGREAVSTEGKE